MTEKTERTQRRQFHLGDLLTVATSRLISPSGMRGAHAILSYMTGDDLFTHQLSRALDVCKEPILEQHPFLKDITVPVLDSEVAVIGWLGEAVKQYGELFDVRPLAPGIYESQNPIGELIEIAASAQARERRPMAPGEEWTGRFIVTRTFQGTAGPTRMLSVAADMEATLREALGEPTLCVQALRVAPPVATPIVQARDLIREAADTVQASIAESDISDSRRAYRRALFAKLQQLLKELP